MLWKKPLLSCVVVAFSVLISAATIACLNWKHAGAWTGFPVGQQTFAWGRQQELDSPLWGIAGNMFCLPAQNLLPPFFPWAVAWNEAMQHFLQTGFGKHFAQFEVFGRLDGSITTANAGVGLGIIFLAAVSVGGAFYFRQSAAARNFAQRTKKISWQLRLLPIAPWISLLVFMAKVGTYENARQAAPYYALLFPVFLTGAGHARLVRRRGWQWLAVGVLCFTFVCVGFLRGRSMLPVALAEQLEKKHPHGIWSSVFGNYFSARAVVESERNFLQNSGADGEKIIGFATICTGAEPGWWLPFGRREVERILPEDTPLALRQKGIRYVVVENVFLRATGQTLEQWMKNDRGEPVKELDFKNSSDPARQLFLVRLRE